MKPLDPFNRLTGRQVYDACVPHTYNIGLKERLEGSSAEIGIAEFRLMQSLLASIPSGYVKTNPALLQASAAELKDLYPRVLRDGGQRSIWEDILAIAKQCPQCGYGRVRSLDHYLPRSTYPELSVIPINLVPVCGDCNFEKGGHDPVTIEECVFHPYIDNWGSLQLFATSVEIGPPVKLIFEVVQPLNCSDSLFERAKIHFAIFALNLTFDIAVAQHLSFVKTSCRFASTFGGAAGVAAWLNGQLETAQRNDRSSWQTAMYQGLSDSRDFVDGGWTNIVDTVTVIPEQKIALPTLSP